MAANVPPPPPTISPDGRFYWDGQQWLPMPATATPAPPAPAASGYQATGTWTPGRIVAVTIIASILVGVVVVLALAAAAQPENYDSLLAKDPSAVASAMDNLVPACRGAYDLDACSAAADHAFNVTESARQHLAAARVPLCEKASADEYRQGLELGEQALETLSTGAQARNAEQITAAASLLDQATTHINQAVTLKRAARC